PPSFTSEGSWKGRTQWPRAGSGMQTVGRPCRIGIPSAPGYVPKYESKERFSCMMMITCLILWIAGSIAARGVPTTAHEVSTRPSEDSRPSHRVRRISLAIRRFPAEGSGRVPQSGRGEAVRGSGAEEAPVGLEGRGRSPARVIEDAVQAAGPALANRRDPIEVDDLDDELLAVAEEEQHAALGIDADALAAADRGNRVHVHHISLIHDGVRPREDELLLAVGRGGERWVEDELGSIERQAASDLRKPAVVADHEAERADPGDLEHRCRAIARRGGLERLPGEQLPVCADQPPLGVEHDRRVVDAFPRPLVDRA